MVFTDNDNKIPELFQGRGFIFLRPNPKFFLGKNMSIYKKYVNSATVAATENEST